MAQTQYICRICQWKRYIFTVYRKCYFCIFNNAFVIALTVPVILILSLAFVLYFIAFCPSTAFPSKSKYSRIRHNIVFELYRLPHLSPNRFYPFRRHIPLPDPNINHLYICRQAPCFSLPPIPSKRSLSRLSFTVKYFDNIHCPEVDRPNRQALFHSSCNQFPIIITSFIITIYKCIEFIHNIINRNRLSVITDNTKHRLRQNQYLQAH